MARTIPTTEPQVLIVGDTWQWNRTFSEFPPSEGWTVAYILNGPTETTLPTSPSSGVYVVNSNSLSLSAVPLPGTYQWAAYATGSGSFAGQRFQITAGVFTVLPNLATASAFTTHEELVLANLEAAIQSRTSGDFENYSLDGRSITKIPIEKLIALRSIYQHKLWKIRNPGKLGPVFAVTFGPPQ